jgi:hypothetical protein
MLSAFVLAIALGQCPGGQCAQPARVPVVSRVVEKATDVREVVKTKVTQKVVTRQIERRRVFRRLWR